MTKLMATMGVFTAPTRRFTFVTSDGTPARWVHPLPRVKPPEIPVERTKILLLDTVDTKKNMELLTSLPTFSEAFFLGTVFTTEHILDVFKIVFDKSEKFEGDTVCLSVE